MTDKELILKIKQLNEIKPRREWVVFAKSQIFESGIENKVVKKISLGEKMSGILDVFSILTYQRKLAYALTAFVFILVGAFGFAQYTVPGDLLFSVKKATERSQTVFTGGNNLKNSLENYDRRVQDLVKIVKEKKESNIPSAITEVKASMAGAVKLLAAATDKNKNIKEIANEVKRIEDNNKQLQSLGIDVGTAEEVKELDNILAPLIELEIKSLEEATLTEEQQEKLNTIKELYTEGKFAQALENILLINK